MLNKNQTKINFTDICIREINKINQNEKNNKKHQNSFLKNFSTYSTKEAENTLEKFADLCFEQYQKKSALHWACQNKNHKVLEVVIQYFILHKKDICIQCEVSKNNFYNISNYCLDLKNYTHLLISLSYNIAIQNDFPYGHEKSNLYHFFKEIETNDLNKYNNIVSYTKKIWKCNPLNISFWHNHYELLNIILENNFEEKTVWLNQLIEEIIYFSQYEQCDSIILDRIIFGLGNHLPFQIIFNLLNKCLKNSKFSQYNFVSSSLDLFLNLKFNNTDDFNKFILTSFLNGMEKDWLDFYSHIKNKTIDKYVNMQNINKLYLSYSLNKNLTFNTVKEKLHKL